MFDRELVELVTISKSARKLKVVPWKHVVSGLPARSLTPLTAATLTSLAVQFSASDWLVDPAGAPLKMLYSFCKQFCANAGGARMAIASSATGNRTNHFEVLHRVNLGILVRIFSPRIPFSLLKSRMCATPNNFGFIGVHLGAGRD